ncbi:AAA family ATPase [Halofilum ochraceum]|uniref:AAA family ATPase n=1 Tax=Halofilum ochraceum TaxID=1611323 RepID=UPI0008D94740|nr:AAA family ATPase [Halofilum ochraceum]
MSTGHSVPAVERATGAYDGFEDDRDFMARPLTTDDTGLGEGYLADLVVKHLYGAGVLDLGELAARMALSGALLEEVLGFLRTEGQVEVRGAVNHSGLLRYCVTDRGRASALEALARDGYVGPAPITLADYQLMVKRQSAKADSVTRAAVHRVFADTVIRPELLDRLGPALHSERAMFLYGAPGTGKSFIARRLSRLLSGSIFVPHAVMVADKAVRCFDPGLHRVAPDEASGSPVALKEGFDRRYVRCQRPIVTTGGELTLDMLDLQYDEATRVHHAPPQLKANGGLLVIDDLGRQRVDPIDLFNRWIVPLEEGRDFLALRNGQHFEVPFDLTLVFSTNRDPLELADEAFLRRIGYKIRFDAMTADAYTAIWRQECERRGLEFDPAIVEYVIADLHGHDQVPLLPCHPRDLIDLAVNRSRYTGEETLTPEAMDWAWGTYFVRLD